MAKILGVIPARFEASRFRGKLLEPLHGRPVLEWVYRRACLLEGIDRLLIATDDERIEETAQGFGAEVLRTSSSHRSGTDRIGEVLEEVSRGSDGAPEFVVNLQGDEPLLPVAAVDAMIAAMVTSAGSALFTLVHRIESDEEFARPSVVKVVVGNGRALYFSRSPIPYPRSEDARVERWRHVGIYGYPTHLLRRWLALEPSPLEECEGLEQLRALEAGIEFRVIESDAVSPGIDVPEDLSRLAREVSREQMERGIR